jgi:hypothetical protein
LKIRLESVVYRLRIVLTVLLFAASLFAGAEAWSGLCVKGIVNGVAGVKEVAPPGTTDVIGDQLIKIMSRIESERGGIQISFFKKYKNDAVFAEWCNHQPKEAFADTDKLAAKYKAFRLKTKNPPAMKKKVIDLDRGCIELDLGLCEKVFDTDQSLLYGTGFPPQFRVTGSDRLLSHVRAGDELRIGGQRFQIGEFLGSGNASHVFALKDHPDLVIKLPYVPPYFFLNYTSQRKTVQQSFIEEFVKHRPEGLNAVEVKGWGRHYEYAIAGRVNGNENGADFISKLRSLGAVSADDRYKFNRLAYWVKRVEQLNPDLLKSLNALQGGNESNALEIIGRQYVWDTVKRDWFLVDWEQTPEWFMKLEE